MKSLTLLEASELIWSRPKLARREFELHHGTELVASLKWQRQFGSLATGECAEGTWTFKRAGFLRPRVTVRAINATTDIAQYEAGWAGGGQLLFADGHGYYWRQRSFWQNVWAFENESNQVVTRFRNEPHVFKQRVQLSLLDVGSNCPDRSLLSILGLYLMILTQEDTATATIIVSS